MNTRLTNKSLFAQPKIRFCSAQALQQYKLQQTKIFTVVELREVPSDVPFARSTLRKNINTYGDLLQSRRFNKFWEKKTSTNSMLLCLKIFASWLLHSVPSFRCEDCELRAASAGSAENRPSSRTRSMAKSEDSCIQSLVWIDSMTGKTKDS